MTEGSSALRERIRRLQRDEITEHHIYLRLARRASPENRGVLERVAAVSFGLGYLARLFLGVEV